MRKIIEDFIYAYKRCAQENTEQSIYHLYYHYDHVLYNQDYIGYDEVLYMLNSLKDDFADDGSLDDSFAEYLIYHIDNQPVEPSEVLYIDGKFQSLLWVKYSTLQDSEIVYEMSTPECANLRINKHNYDYVVNHIATNEISLNTIDIRYFISLIHWYPEEYPTLIDGIKTIFRNSLKDTYINDFGVEELNIIHKILDWDASQSRSDQKF